MSHCHCSSVAVNFLFNGCGVSPRGGAAVVGVLLEAEDIQVKAFVVCVNGLKCSVFICWFPVVEFI